MLIACFTDSIILFVGKLWFFEVESFRLISHNDVFFAGQTVFITVDDSTVVEEELRPTFYGVDNELWHLQNYEWVLVEWVYAEQDL